MTSLNWITRRLMLLSFTLWLVSLLTFIIVNLLPGDIAHVMLGDSATPEQLLGLQQQLGLDRPFWGRYWSWVGRFLTGDLGTSLQYGQPVADMLTGRLGNSAILGALALLISVPVALGLGTLTAVYQNTWVDRTLTSLLMINFGLPEYVTGVLLILLFSVYWPILPGSSLTAPGDNPFDHPKALVLPVIVLTLSLITYVSQITRTGMIAALDSNYVRTAILKGLPKRQVVLSHALPNVMLPVINEVGMHVGYVIGGMVVVESLFSYSGVGQLMINAVNYRDVPTVQATVLVVAIAYGVGNLLADLVAQCCDPRTRNRS